MGFVHKDWLNKRRYWPEFISEKVIKFYMTEYYVVTQASLPGKLDGICFDVFNMKKTDYTMMHMYTYSKIAVSEGYN